MQRTADKDDLLRVLEAHGQQFLHSFSSPVSIGKRKEPLASYIRQSKKQKVNEGLDEEWSGIGGSNYDGSDVEGPEGANHDSDFQTQRGSAAVSQPDVIVFSEKQTKSDPPPKVSKAQMKAFMSSKITKLTQDVQEESSDGEGSEDDELTNAQNDALLHRLVHTRILSGSLNPDLDLKPAQRKKALAGRVLEAAGKVKLGKGESIVRSTERNKAAKHVREGLAVKLKERSEKELEEAKHLGNYHPTLKKVYDASSQGPARKRKREKGLKMGVGSFSGGVLRLSKDDIRSVEDSDSRGHFRSKRRGGKR